MEEFASGRISPEALDAAISASSTVEYTSDGAKRSEPGYSAVKNLGRGFYKMTAAASAILVCSAVAFMADDAYRQHAQFEFNCCYDAAAGVFLEPFEWPEPIPEPVQRERDVLAGILRQIFGDSSPADNS